MNAAIHLRRNGFSLVEMMVVLFVMGLLAAVVVMTLPGDEAALRNEAERMAARTVAARDQAIATASPVSLVVGDAGYYFERRDDGRWLPLSGFELTAWSKGTQAAVGEGRTRLVFDSLGLASADATVRLARDDRRLAVHIARNGQVRLDAQ
ncbi:GspH/FimT family pseudopilin [Novosphingobium cyanobacteriorum]|uniref:Type II secretion system protein H n=1 Tax=Novosphingobium cyanobacteriorum TaxID=3024215 RepID=A0ABT6CQW4_9SPHN|nr:GspH/FimT family pseudopilin [Novosphingobium cyanobacteriorum]MDF8334862.1 GspH/FimT family pseudopilin [Novosphingobium cyanobacteriorum]